MILKQCSEACVLALRQKAAKCLLREGMAGEAEIWKGIL